MSLSKSAPVGSINHNKNIGSSSSASSSACCLRLINVTDTYKFDNFPSLKTLIDEKKKNEYYKEGIVKTTTKSIMSGDFLAPYLLSSYDDGEGMMKVLNEIPIDILTWGNHDINDLSDGAVMKREREFHNDGIWINSNMTNHPTFQNSKCQVKYHIEEITSYDGTNTRRIGLLGLITDDPKLFKNCNPGMKKWSVENPWDTIRELLPLLTKPPNNCDLIIPICHLYEKEDAITCQQFDGFPVILSGHDHHIVDEIINGTRLLKAGSDCEFAIQLDICWWGDNDSTSKPPTIEAKHLKVSDWKPNDDIVNVVNEVQSIIQPLMHTKLAEVPKKFIPLSTIDERGFFGGLKEATNRQYGTQCTMGQFILSLMRDALNTDDNPFNDVDGCVMKGGNIKCSQVWSSTEHSFTLAMLFSLWSPEKQCHIFTLPGHILQNAFVKSYDRPNNGWIHHDDGIKIDPRTGTVTQIGHKQLDLNKLYRIASGNDLQRSSDGPIIGEYLKNHPEHMPNPELAIPVSFVLLQHTVKTIWRQVWQILDPNRTGKLDHHELSKYDFDGDGNLNKDEILELIKVGLNWPIHESQDTLVDRIFENVGLDAAVVSSATTATTTTAAAATTTAATTTTASSNRSVIETESLSKSSLSQVAAAAAAAAAATDSTAAATNIRPSTRKSDTTSSSSPRSSFLSLEHLNDLYQAHQGRPSGAWFFSRASGVYNHISIYRHSPDGSLQDALKDLEHLDF